MKILVIRLKQIGNAPLSYQALRLHHRQRWRPNHISIAVGTLALAVFSPINSKYAWIPEFGDRYQGIDMSDVLGITPQAHRDRMAESGAGPIRPHDHAGSGHRPRRADD